jgi:hypothetical protein
LLRGSNPDELTGSRRKRIVRAQEKGQFGGECIYEAVLNNCGEMMKEDETNAMGKMKPGMQG